MNYPVTHRQTDNGHCDWPFRWASEGDASDEARSGGLRPEPEVSALRAPPAIAGDR